MYKEGKEIMTKTITRMQPESHAFDDRYRLRFQPLELKPDENGKESFVVFKCKHEIDGEEIKYLEVWDATDLPDIMTSEQIGRLSSFEQSKLFGNRRYVCMDNHGRVNFGEKLVDYLDKTKNVVTVPIIRKCKDSISKGVAVWAEKDYLKHIDPNFAGKTR